MMTKTYMWLHYATSTTIVGFKTYHKLKKMKKNSRLNYKEVRMTLKKYILIYHLENNYKAQINKWILEWNMTKYSW